MNGYEEKVLMYCRERVLPGGYKISDDLKRKIEDDRQGYKKTRFFLSLPVTFQLCLSYLLEHEPLTEEYLLYLLMEDNQSPDDPFIHNFQIVLRIVH